MDERTAASIGPRDLKQKGSTEWCWQTVSWLKSMWQSKTITDQRFSEVLEELADYKVFEKIPPDNPYGSLDSLLETEIGVSTTEIQVAIAQAKERRIQAAWKSKPEEILPNDGSINPGNAVQFAQHITRNRASKSGISLRTQRKLDHLARFRPDLLECVKDGELSADKAHKIARDIKDPTTLEKLQKLWQQAAHHEKVAFLSWIEAISDSRIHDSPMPNSK